jgi:hypothetical protein
VFRDFLVRRQSDEKEASRQLAGIIRTFFTAVHEEMQGALTAIVKAIILARVSSKDQEEGYVLNAQE